MYILYILYILNYLIFTYMAKKIQFALTDPVVLRKAPGKIEPNAKLVLAQKMKNLVLLKLVVKLPLSVRAKHSRKTNPKPSSMTKMITLNLIMVSSQIKIQASLKFLNKISICMKNSLKMRAP